MFQGRYSASNCDMAEHAANQGKKSCSLELPVESVAGVVWCTQPSEPEHNGSLDARVVR